MSVKSALVLGYLHDDRDISTSCRHVISNPIAIVPPSDLNAETFKATRIHTSTDSVMSGLGIPGFVVGLSGRTAVAEKGFVIWRSIGVANVFGPNVVEDVAKLSMEYYRFEAWTNAVSFLLTAQKRSQSKPTALGMLSPFLEPAAPTTNIHDALLRQHYVMFRETHIYSVVKFCEYRQEVFEKNEDELLP
ncbi:hypothetical protein HO173_010410 [Letharia columbiana]|uniref:Uncharacterized protein n=1 Tax=Letharia columbiana TaxID=112416 RepID=A0A8H6L0Y0_9LECA|nr:uncharacterized protein HO173_010410 [Letharia columbiana]KAF6231449.1 hypothetical protein HO173_010410 [Letharia columbiana]